ncbi:thymidylate synthase [Clostridia bacterium]|nr:thymidylate synthase [Clostridia bacterium]
MKIINAGFEIISPIDGEEVLKQIERVGRTCYKSEGKITADSAPKFVKTLIDRGHEAMIEHFSFSVRFICDRGVSHELVRHRIASYAQESTRYCNYGKQNEITVIIPFFFDTGLGVHSNSLVYTEWKSACEHCERAYLKLLEYGATPQEARSVLPNSLKTEIVMTANLREWRAFFKLRCHNTAHPQMREVTTPLLKELKTIITVVFDDIGYEESVNDN